MNQRNELINRIETDPKILSGKPIIHGTRITVTLILGLLAEGWTRNEIAAEYKIDEQDIAACLHFAEQAVDDFACMPLKSDR